MLTEETGCWHIPLVLSGRRKHQSKLMSSPSPAHCLTVASFQLVWTAREVGSCYYGLGSDHCLLSLTSSSMPELWESHFSQKQIPCMPSSPHQGRSSSF